MFFAVFLAFHYQWVWLCLGRLLVFLVPRSPDHKESYLSLMKKTGHYLESMDFELDVFMGGTLGHPLGDGENIIYTKEK